MLLLTNRHRIASVYLINTAVIIASATTTTISPMTAVLPCALPSETTITSASELLGCSNGASCVRIFDPDFGCVGLRGCRNVLVGLGPFNADVG